MSEIEEIAKRYARRKSIPQERYSLLSPAVYLSEQEKERSLIYWLKFASIIPIKDKKLLEIGCGSGGNLLELIRLGFQAHNLIGNDLINERVAEARNKLPMNLKIIEGNALELNLGKESFDVVFQSTVFSSILDKNFQNELANKMWSFLKPGGGVLWYDFIYNNPNNKDVIGIPFNRVRELFPGGKVKRWKITLAPQLSRVVTRIHPTFYYLFNAFPFFRTHILCWIRKPFN